MSSVTANSSRPRRTLQAMLRRVHLRVVLMSVLLIGSCSIALEVVILRMYTLNNLQLVAQSIAYTLEAALVFRDHEAANVTLAEISSHNSVQEAYVFDVKQRNFARWQRAVDEPTEQVQQWLAALILPHPVVSAITHDGIKIGEIRLIADGQALFQLLLWSIGGASVCFFLSSSAAYFLSRKVGQEIVAPLEEITQIAHTARKQQQFTSRVTAASIAELYQLGDDFNALLANLELWQAQVKLEKETLTYKTDHDPLTDLYNRAFFENRLQTAVNAKRDTESMLAVFYIDSDHFKDINDNFGHSVGDEVLRTIGLRLRAQVRKHDVVARLGGDEFAILIDPLPEWELAIRIADNIINNMKEPIALREGTMLKTSLSIGIAVFPKHSDDIEELIKLADEAMYQAKRSNGSAYQVAASASILS